MTDKVNKLEITMAELKKDISFIKESLGKNDDQHREIIGKIDGFVKSADDRFAAKADHKEAIQKFKELSEHIDDTYVTKDTFGPIQKLVYGLVGAILLAVLGAVVALILK
jgi:hypothetical protein